MAPRPTRSRRRGLALALLSFSLLALGARPAVAEVPPFTGPAGGPKVGAVGDSLLGQLQSEGPTHPSSLRAFTLSLNDQGWQASVKHRNAWPTGRIRLLANQSLDRGARVLVVVAGSGDVRVVRESADPVAARQAMVRAIGNLLDDVSGICVVWPTLHPAGGAGERRTAQVLNRELREADAADVDVRVPDWAALAASHPGWFIGDGVHLSRRGEAAFQQTLLAAARRCFASL